MLFSCRSQNCREFCEKLRESLDSLEVNDDKRIIGEHIWYLIMIRKLHINEAQINFLETFDDPLGYLIDISEYDKADNKLAYKIRTNLKKATESFSS